MQLSIAMIIAGVVLTAALSLPRLEKSEPEKIFAQCENLHKAALSECQAYSLEDVTEMLHMCRSLQKRELEGFKLEEVSRPRNMFLYCDPNLKIIVWYDLIQLQADAMKNQ